MTFMKFVKGRGSVAGALSAKSDHQDSLLFKGAVLPSPMLDSVVPEPWALLSKSLSCAETL